VAKLERYYDRFLSEEEWKLYQDAVERVVSQLVGMPQHPHSFGLIHGDFHIGNMVFIQDTPYAIDFGRCGYGYYLYDMAGSILGLWPKHRRIFIQGYESIRKLEPNYARYLEAFFVMLMIENYCHHASNPEEIEGLIREQPYAQAYIREYLKDRPFLFEEIQPVKG
jgi:Ser/Thr protein kinase RdoA (MazF antagonist)